MAFSFKIVFSTDFTLLLSITYSVFLLHFLRCFSFHLASLILPCHFPTPCLIFFNFSQMSKDAFFQVSCYFCTCLLTQLLSLFLSFLKFKKLCEKFLFPLSHSHLRFFFCIAFTLLLSVIYFALSTAWSPLPICVSITFLVMFPFSFSFHYSYLPLFHFLFYFLQLFPVV